MARKWTWLWISEKNTSLLKLIELLNLRLKQLADALDAILSGSTTGYIEFFGYNDGATLIPGDSDWGYIPVACSISGAEIVVEPAGSISLTVATARYPTWETWTTITPSPITLSALAKAQPDVSAWTKSVTAGTYMKVSIVGVTTSITKFTLTLTLTPA